MQEVNAANKISFRVNDVNEMVVQDIVLPLVNAETSVILAYVTFRNGTFLDENYFVNNDYTNNPSNFLISVDGDFYIGGNNLKIYDKDAVSTDGDTLVVDKSTSFSFETFSGADKSVDKIISEHIIYREEDGRLCVLRKMNVESKNKPFFTYSVRGNDKVSLLNIDEISRKHANYFFACKEVRNFLYIPGITEAGIAHVVGLKDVLGEIVDASQNVLKEMVEVRVEKLNKLLDTNSEIDTRKEFSFTRDVPFTGESFTQDAIGVEEILRQRQIVQSWEYLQNSMIF